VLVPARLGPRIADGEVDLLFRRWVRPQVVVGRTYRTAAGRLLVTEVTVVDAAILTAADASRAGFADLPALLAAQRKAAAVPLYRIAVRPADGPDPRDVLSQQADLTADEVAAVSARLDRLDRVAAGGPWTRATLHAIEQRPAVRAPDLAASFGRPTQPFKLDVRKLKALGLTHSLRVGYQLSPRGAAYLAAVRAAEG
jgi:hypothetical protein